MRAKDFIIERILNLHDAQSKQKYLPQVWDLLQRSYAKLPGGFGSASSPEELVNKSALWKLVVRDGEVTTAHIYKDQYGRKSIAGGTNGTPQGKKDYLMIRDQDVGLGRSWTEVSGAPERMMQKMGAKPIPAKFAPLLVKREILSYNEDGYHYTRLIAGHPHEKIMYGKPTFTQEEAEQLRAAGVELHDMPHSVK